MPQDVDIAVIRAELEEGVVRPVPLLEHFLDHVLMFIRASFLLGFVLLTQNSVPLGIEDVDVLDC